jgi:hypothetical protein
MELAEDDNGGAIDVLLFNTAIDFVGCKWKFGTGKGKYW